MKQSGLTIFFAALMTALFSACSDDFGSKEIPSEELYTRAFIKEFGIFDANHTWCAATPTSITVNPQTLLNDVKVYSRTDGKYYYVAHYTDVYKSTTITFDAPRGTTDLKLVIDGTTYYAQAGTTLTVSGGSRASGTVLTEAPSMAADGVYYTGIDTYNGIKNSVPSSDYHYWTSDDLCPVIASSSFTITSSVTNQPVTDLHGVLPEDNCFKNNKEHPYDIYDTDDSGITLDFMFISSGESFIIYPQFWFTNHTNLLGIYTVSTVNGVQTVTKTPLFMSKQYSGNLIQYLVSDWPDNQVQSTDYSYSSTQTDNYGHNAWIDKELEQSIFDALKGTGKYSDIEVGSYSEDDFDEDLWSSLESSVSNNASSIYLSYYNTSNAYKWVLLSDFFGFTLVSFDILSNDSGDDTVNAKYKFTFSSADEDGNTTGGKWTQIISTLSTKDSGSYSQIALYDVPSSPVYSFRTKGIEVTVPPGQIFGFYLTVDGDENPDNEAKTVYSMSYRNPRENPYVCTYQSPVEDNCLFFGFEDCIETTADESQYWDMNDLVLLVYNLKMGEVVHEEEIEDETYTWLICAEDLGTTDDFDFNDMIIAVEAETEGEGDDGYKKLTIRAMAAGGTLPLKLYFNPDKLVTSKKDNCDIDLEKGCLHPTLKSDESAENYEEFHQWFDSGYPSSLMINTGSGADKNGCKGRKCILYVDKDFTLDAKSVATSGNKSSLADFYIVVDNNADNKVIKPSISPTEVKAPQMFVIRDHWDVPNGKYDGETPLYDTVYYQWPTERSDIRTSYDGKNSPNSSVVLSFANWVGYQDTYAEWFKYPTTSVCRYNY